MKIALYVCFLSLVISASSQITLEPNPLTGYEGEDVVVRCVHLPGVTNAQFELRVNGTVFNSQHPKYRGVSSTSTVASYTYGPLEHRTEQGITFTCNDGIGSTDEENITIYSITPVVAVATQPAAVNSVSIQGTNYDSVFVETGDMVDVTCILVSNPVFELYSITRSYKVQENGNVLIGNESNITSSRNGTTAYTITESIMVYCRAVVDGVTLQSESVIIAVSPYNLVTVTPRNSLTRQNEDAVFTCESEGGPGNTFEWYHGNQLLSSETALLLEITMVTPSDAGVYNCTVTNAAGSGSGVATLTVGVVIDTQPVDVLAKISEEVSFYCEASGSDPISYAWFLEDGTQVESGGRITGSDSSTLTITGVVSSDYGEYFCNVSNIVNSQRSEGAVLTVSPFGTVVVWPENSLVMESDNVTLTCSADGGPNNNYVWFYGSTSLTNGPVLELSDIRARDGGEYTCVVSNAAGSDRETGTISVDPVITSDPIGANITLFTGHMISCEARGSPQPIIVWYRNDSLINLETARGLSITMTTIHVVVHSQLRFLNATFEDSGVYWCEARPLHLGGTPASSARVNITVQSVPERPVSVAVMDTTHVSVLLVWMKPHDNNAEITGYEVSVRDDTNSDGLTTTQHTAGAVVMLNVTGLKPFTNYTFEVFANNSLGRSPPSVPVTTSTDEFYTDLSTVYPPLLEKFIFPSHLAVVLLWSVPTFVADDIDGFVISVVMVTSRGPRTIQRMTAGKHVRAYGVYFPERGASYQVTVHMTMNGLHSRPLTVEVDF